MKGKVHWTKAVISRLIELWKMRLTRRAICERLQTEFPFECEMLTRNSVLAKLYRLGCNDYSDQRLTAEEAEALRQAEEKAGREREYAEWLARQERERASLIKGGRTCIADGCRGPKQPGRDFCATCLSARAKPNKRAGTGEVFVGTQGNGSNTVSF